MLVKVQTTETSGHRGMYGTSFLAHGDCDSVCLFTMASYTDGPHIHTDKLSDIEEKLCEELKEVVENFRWQKVGRKEEFKGKTCTRYEYD